MFDELCRPLLSTLWYDLTKHHSIVVQESFMLCYVILPVHVFGPDQNVLRIHSKKVLLLVSSSGWRSICAWPSAWSPSSSSSCSLLLWSRWTCSRTLFFPSPWQPSGSSTVSFVHASRSSFDFYQIYLIRLTVFGEMKIRKCVCVCLSSVWSCSAEQFVRRRQPVPSTLQHSVHEWSGSGGDLCWNRHALLYLQYVAPPPPFS